MSKDSKILYTKTLRIDRGATEPEMAFRVENVIEVLTFTSEKVREYLTRSSFVREREGVHPKNVQTW